MATTLIISKTTGRWTATSDGVRMRTQETLDEKIERLLANLSAINTSMAALEVVKKDKTELESPEERKRRQEAERKRQNDKVLEDLRKQKRT